MFICAWNKFICPELTLITCPNFGKYVCFTVCGFICGWICPGGRSQLTHECLAYLHQILPTGVLWLSIDPFLYSRSNVNVYNSQEWSKSEVTIYHTVFGLHQNRKTHCSPTYRTSSWHPQPAKPSPQPQIAISSGCWQMMLISTWNVMNQEYSITINGHTHFQMLIWMNCCSDPYTHRLHICTINRWVSVRKT